MLLAGTCPFQDDSLKIQPQFHPCVGVLIFFNMIWSSACTIYFGRVFVKACPHLIVCCIYFYNLLTNSKILWNQIEMMDIPTC